MQILCAPAATSRGRPGRNVIEDWCGRARRLQSPSTARLLSALNARWLLRAPRTTAALPQRAVRRMIARQGFRKRARTEHSTSLVVTPLPGVAAGTPHDLILLAPRAGERGIGIPAVHRSGNGGRGGVSWCWAPCSRQDRVEGGESAIIAALIVDGLTWDEKQAHGRDGVASA